MMRRLHAQPRQQTMGRQPRQMAVHPPAGAGAAKRGKAANGRVLKGLKGITAVPARRRRGLQRRQRSQRGDGCRSGKVDLSDRCAMGAACQLSRLTKSQLDVNLEFRALCGILMASTSGSHEQLSPAEIWASGEHCNSSSDRRQDAAFFGLIDTALQWLPALGYLASKGLY